jgi:hypothetical protein
MEPTVAIAGPGKFALAVVGESRYQKNLETICGPRCEDGVDHSAEATLVLEDANPHDASAVRVDIAGLTVGYLSREHARQYRSELAKAGQPRVMATCAAKIRGGWDRGPRNRGDFGVWLDLPMSPRHESS